MTTTETPSPELTRWFGRLFDEVYKTQTLVADTEYVIDKRIEHHLNKHWLRIAAVVIGSNAATIMVLGVLT